MSNKINILMLHGFMCDAESGKKVLAGLTSSFKGRFNIYALDLPGHNGVPYDLEGGMPYIVNYIYNETIKLGITDFYIAGFSFGGVCALEYAKVHKVLGLIVMASPVTAFSLALNLTTHLAKTILTTLPNNLFELCKSSNFVIKRGKKYDMNLLRLKKRELVALLNLQSSLSPYLLPTSIPALYIYDNADKVVSTKNIEYLRSHMSANAKLEIIKGGGHFYTSAGISKVNELIAEFCK